MHAGGEKTTGNVPAFLMKVWTLVEDPATDELIYWDASGTSFHVFDQQRFSREILPLFFKHNNIASFIRQLNMYGFRKVAHIDQGSLKIENDDLHFQHPYFQRGERDLLQHIKRKVSNQTVRADSLTAVKSDEVSRILTDVSHMKSKQDDMDHNLEYIKRENKLLWRELATLRQKHHKQQEIVNKLIQFLVSLVSSNRAGLTIPALRRAPLAIDSNQVSTSAPVSSSSPAMDQQFLSSNTPANYTIESPKSVDLRPLTPNLGTGPIIHELPEVLETTDKKGSHQFMEGRSAKGAFNPSPHLKTPPLLISQRPNVSIHQVSSPDTSPSSSSIKIPAAPSLQDALNFTYASPLQDSPPSTQQDTTRRKRNRPPPLGLGEPGTKKSPGSQSQSFSHLDGALTPDIQEQANSTLDQLVMASPSLDTIKLTASKDDATLAVPTFNAGDDGSLNTSSQLDFLNSDLDGLRGLLQEQYKVDPAMLMDLFDSSNPWSVLSEKPQTDEEQLLCDKEHEPGTSCLDNSNGDIIGTELVQYNPKELFPELLDDNVIGDIDDLD